MDRRLLDYLPPVLREVLEFQAINEANEPEISLAWDALALVLANQFLDTADSSGVSVWEKELRIFPKDTDTLEVRKARIKATLLDGAEVRLKPAGFLARTLLHEIDHLDGILFIDHIKDDPQAFYQLDDKGDLIPLDYEKHIKGNKALFPDDDDDEA